MKLNVIMTTVELSLSNDEAQALIEFLGKLNTLNIEEIIGDVKEATRIDALILDPLHDALDGIFN